MSRYVGWGGIPEAFDKQAGAWHTEYAMLKDRPDAGGICVGKRKHPDGVLHAARSDRPPFIMRSRTDGLSVRGTYLEPSCGIGNFIGMLPQSMENAKIYGVELDTDFCRYRSAALSEILYRRPSGFEEVNVPDSFFDGVVGNVPFGDFKVSRQDGTTSTTFSFTITSLRKALDKLRPGGCDGACDKQRHYGQGPTPAVRKYIAQRAELLGAIRTAERHLQGQRRHGGRIGHSVPAKARQTDRH